MGDRRCCCGCWTASYSFTRSDSTDLGSDWEECDGNWEILSNQLKANSTGQVVWKKSPISSGTRSGIMTIKIISPSDGAHYRIYAFVDGCEDTGPVYADVSVADVSGTLVATVDVGGTGITSTGATSNSISSGHTLTFCVGETEIMAYMTNSTYPSRACHDGSANDAGIYFMLSNESETDVAIFDDAWQTDHYDHNTDCPSCGCDCQGKCMPLSLCLTITNETGCTALDGHESTLESSGACAWTSDAFDCAPYFGIYWELVATGLWVGVTGACTDFTLTLRSSAGAAMLSMLSAPSCSCDPIMMEWTGREIDSDSYSSNCCEGYTEVCGTSDCAAVIPGPPPPATQYCWCPGKFTVTLTECP